MYWAATDWGLSGRLRAADWGPSGRTASPAAGFSSCPWVAAQTRAQSFLCTLMVIWSLSLFSVFRFQFISLGFEVLVFTPLSLVYISQPAERFSLAQVFLDCRGSGGRDGSAWSVTVIAGQLKTELHKQTNSVTSTFYTTHLSHCYSFIGALATRASETCHYPTQSGDVEAHHDASHSSGKLLGNCDC